MFLKILSEKNLKSYTKKTMSQSVTVTKKKHI